MQAGDRLTPSSGRSLQLGHATSATLTSQPPCARTSYSVRALPDDGLELLSEKGGEPSVRQEADLPPGQKVPESGQYPVVGPRGGSQGSEVTSAKGERFPPTPEPGQGYGRPDKTKHRSK